MKLKEEKKSLRKKTTNELYKELSKTREKITNLKRNLAFGKLKSPQKISREKIKVAFILTIIREKTEKELENN